MANLDELLSHSKKFLEALNIDPQAGVLVAFSGGPDSTALLCFFANQFAGIIRIGAAHFDHKLRGDEQSIEETHNAAETARKLGIEFHHGSAREDEVTNYAKMYKISVEEAARVLRYTYLRSVAESHRYAFIATGHTADDLAETLIQRFFQGSGVAGLSGIPKTAGNIVRPILEWSREDVTTFNASQGAVPFEDPSNKHEQYLRNKVRHTLLPAIHETFPGFRRSLVTLAEKMKLERDFLQQYLEERVFWEKEDKAFTIGVNAFLSLHPVERIESVRSLYDDTHTGEAGTLRLPFRAFALLVNVPRLRENSILMRGWGYRLQVHDDKVFFEPDVVFRGEKGYFMVVKESGEQGWSESFSAANVRVRRSSGSGFTSLPLDRVAFPLIVRSRREGDAIKVGSFSKEIKKLYNEWNVPEQTRWKIPVCEDKTGIIAVFGSLFGFPDVKTKSQAPAISIGSVLFETS